MTLAILIMLMVIVSAGVLQTMLIKQCLNLIAYFVTEFRRFRNGR